MREFRQLGVIVRQNNKLPLNYEDYLELSKLSARHVAQYIQYSQSKLALERRRCFDDLNEYAETYLRQQNDEQSLYDQCLAFLLQSLEISRKE
jgi:hypothetical protein